MAAGVAVAVGEHGFAVDHLFLGVEVLHLFAEGGDEAGVAFADEIGVAEAGPGAGVEGVAVGHFVDFAVVDGEVPAVGAFVPLAAVLAAGLAIEADVGGDIAAVRVGALLPGADVFEDPIFVFLFPGEHVGVEGETGGGEVEGVVADAVEILVAVGEHFVVDAHEVDHAAAALLAVKEVEGAGDGVADPVIGGGFMEHGAFAAGPDALDDFVNGVVVGGFGILVHVEAGEAFHAEAEDGVGGIGQAEEHEGADAFAGVEPIGLGDELFVVGAVCGQFGFDGAHLLVLQEVAFEGFFVVGEDGVGAAEGVEEGPVVEGFDGVIGAVEGAPAGGVEEVAAGVEVLVGEAVAGEGALLEQFAFEQSPGGGRDGFIDLESRLGEGGGGHEDEESGDFHFGNLQMRRAFSPRIRRRSWSE